MGKIRREEPFEGHTKGISGNKKGSVRYRKGIVVGRPKFKKSVPVGLPIRIHSDRERLSIDVVTYHVFIVDKQVIVTVQAASVFLAETGRYFTVLSRLAP